MSYTAAKVASVVVDAASILYLPPLPPLLLPLLLPELALPQALTSVNSRDDCAEVVQVASNSAEFYSAGGFAQRGHLVGVA
jgi:hypothetical protein